MGLFDRILNRAAPSATIKASDAFLAEFFGVRTGSFQADVNKETAGGLPVAYACVSLISQTLASMPLHLFQRTDGDGRKRATSHPLYTALHDMASDTITAYELREFLIASLLVHGNAYALIKWSNKGQVESLTPCPANTVTVERLTSSRLRYHVTSSKGARETYTQDDILHIRHRLDANALYGLSPITVARAAFNLGISQAEQAHGQAKRGFRPQGVLSFPNPIGDDGKGTALNALSDKAADTTDKGGVLVLDGGVTWSPMAFNSRDAEFLDSRRLNDLAIARIFHCPPTSVGIPDHATFSNVYAENQALIARCLAPVAKRVEQALKMALLPPSARKAYYIEHDLGALLRGDLEARYNSYSVARNGGWLSANEIRALENMPKITDGDSYLTPLNMQKDNDDASVE